MDNTTYNILETIYDNGGRLYAMDKRSPLVNCTAEKKAAYLYARKTNLLYEQDGLFLLTIEGRAAVEQHRYVRRAYHLSIAAIIISIIALLKPSNLGLVDFMIEALSLIK